MTVLALKKTTTKSDGGLYTDAIHKIVGARVTVAGAVVTMNIQTSMYKDLTTANTNGASALSKSYSIDISNPNVAAAVAALQDAIYEQIKATDDNLSDAEEITDD